MKEKYGGLCHKTPPNMISLNNDTKIFKGNKDYIENAKYRQTGAGRGYAGIKNPGGDLKTR